MTSRVPPGSGVTTADRTDSVMGSWARWYWFLVVFCAVAAVASRAEAFRNLKQGDPAPDFALKSVKGETVGLAAQKGKAVVVAFVQEGQDKSEKLLHALAALDPSLAEKTQVLAILVESGTGGDVGAWVNKIGMSFPLLLDPSKDVYAKYGVFVTPVTGVIKPDGSFLEEMAGYSASTKEETEALLKVALGLATAEGLKAEAEKAKVPELSKERKMAERELEKAKKLLERKMKDKAVEAAKTALKTDPTYAAAHSFSGRLLLDLSDNNADEAMAQFQKALELDPRDADANLGAARVKALKGDYDGAVSTLEEGVKHSAKPERVYFQLGIVHEKAGRFDKAVAAYRNALEKVLGE